MSFQNPCCLLRALLLACALLMAACDATEPPEPPAATLAITEADPLIDVANSRKIAAVVARGRLYPRQDLDRMLAVQ